jgi:hypothetical protein
MALLISLAYYTKTNLQVAIKKTISPFQYTQSEAHVAETATKEDPFLLQMHGRDAGVDGKKHPFPQLSAAR